MTLPESSKFPDDQVHDNSQKNHHLKELSLFHSQLSYNGFFGIGPSLQLYHIQCWNIGMSTWGLKLSLGLGAIQTRGNQMCRLKPMRVTLTQCSVHAYIHIPKWLHHGSPYICYYSCEMMLYLQGISTIGGVCYGTIWYNTARAINKPCNGWCLQMDTCVDQSM